MADKATDDASDVTYALEQLVRDSVTELVEALLADSTVTVEDWVLPLFIPTNPAGASLLGRARRWLRRHMTRDGRQLAKRLEACRL